MHHKLRIKVYFFIPVRIAQVAQPMLFKNGPGNFGAIWAAVKKYSLSSHEDPQLCKK